MITEFNPDEVYLSPDDIGSHVRNSSNYSTNCAPNPVIHYVRLKLHSKLEWATLYSTDYEALRGSASQIFPELIGKNFEFKDAEGAIIRAHFLQSFLNFSPNGVIINVVPDTILNILEAVPNNEINESNILDIRVESPAISVYSNAYTRGTHSCSTDTLYSVPSVSSSCTNFDEDVENILSNNTPPRKRAKTAAIPYHHVTAEEFKNYLLSHSGGKEVISFYKDNKTLDDPHRKKLVNITVGHMLQYMPVANIYPCIETKIEYARILVKLFPRIRDRTTQEGFEAFFDPVTKKGYFTIRLQNLFREKSKVTSFVKENDPPEVNNDDNVEEKVSFLKYATKDQKDEIFLKTKETFIFRNKDRHDLAERFPRFIDTIGLISFEFNLMFPSIPENIFVQTFAKYVPHIKNIYKTTVTNPDSGLIRESTDSEDWNTTTKALLILIKLFPPKPSKQNKRISSANAIEKLLIFQDLQIPLTTVIENRASKQPFIVAVGTSKAAVSAYYTVFDNHIIPCSEPDILTAFDCCFKTYFVFHLEFDKALEHFFKFVQIQFYNIDVGSVTMTNRMRELRTKFDATFQD